MKKNRLQNEKTGKGLFLIVTVFFLLVGITFYQCRQLAVKEAENSLAGFLLNNRAIHSFVSETQRPEVFRLVDEELLDADYFSPKLFSRTYIARSINDALNEERKSMGMDQIFFKLASKNPRNTVNSGNAMELELLEKFNTGELNEFKNVINTGGEKFLYYAIPSAPNDVSCMRCHGEPADAPREMVNIYGDRAGFYEKIGDIRAFISVRVPLARHLAAANKTAFIISVLMLFLLASLHWGISSFCRKIETQKELAEENAYYLHSILQSSKDTAIAAIDLNYNVKYFNSAAETLLNIPVAVALGSSVTAFQEQYGGDEKSFHQTIEKVQTHGAQEFILKHNNRTIQAEISLIKDDADRNAGYLLLGHDLTSRIADEKEKAQIKERLQKAEKMESLGMMAGGVAHDLNNILSGIVSYPQLLLMKLPQESELRGPVKAIQESGERAAIVVSDLLTVARGVASTREAHDLHTLIREYLNSPEFERLTLFYPDIRYAKELRADESLILCSQVHVMKCLMNLITNGFESIGDEGDILLTTHNQVVTGPSAKKHNLSEGNYVVLRVIDNGPGISIKDMDHIFEPFYTRKVMGKSGSGLGLAVVYNTMKDHEGWVEVKSSSKETVFELYFPVSEQKKAAAPSEMHKEELNGKGEYILVVDDEPYLRDIASETLRSFGYRVDSVCSGELALKFVAETPVDLIVLDMLMEPGLNGRETYEEIVKIYPEQKAIIVSGFSESDDVKAALERGVKGFIKKPYSVTALAKAVKTALTAV